MLCSSKTLKDAVREDPEDAEALCDAAGLRPWQRELLADALWTAYRGSGASSASSDGPASSASAGSSSTG